MPLFVLTLQMLFPEANLAPAPDQRASYYRWLFFAAGPLESAVLNKNLGFNVSDEQQRTAGYGNFDLTIDTLGKGGHRKAIYCRR